MRTMIDELLLRTEKMWPNMTSNVCVELAELRAAADERNKFCDLLVENNAVDASDLRGAIISLQRTVASQADSLRHWTSLWEYIIKRLGGVDGTLPNESNFDALLVSTVEAQSHYNYDLCIACQKNKPAEGRSTCNECVDWSEAHEA